MSFISVDTKSIVFNPFAMIEDDWFLITAIDKEGKINTMTAASGALGHMFRKNVAYINVRPTRYTKEFIDSNGLLSLSFFSNTPDHKKILGYLGKVSGRDEDKIAKSGLTVEYCQGIPYFTNAHTIFLCRVLFMQSYSSISFVDKSVEEYYYPKHDYHDMYICDIMETLIKGKKVTE